MRVIKAGRVGKVGMGGWVRRCKEGNRLKKVIREGVFGRLWEGSETCCKGCRGCVMVLEGGKVL